MALCRRRWFHQSIHSQGREFDLDDAGEEAAVGDELGLVEADHAFGHRVVVAVATQADKGHRADLPETLGVADRGELRSAIDVVHELIKATVRAQIAISSASRASSARRWRVSCQPTIRRLNTSMMNARNRTRTRSARR